MTRFDDAFNIELYSLLNGRDTMPSTDWATDLCGTHIADAFASGNASEYFFNFGLGDLEGFLGIFPSVQEFPLHNEPPGGPLRGFVLLGPSRDCAAAPVPGYPGSA